MADFYAKNPDQFKQGERVRASHILITAAAGCRRRHQGAGARHAPRASSRTSRRGKDFAALAKEHSQDPGSAVQGGDLGFFTQGQMVGPFNDAAFSLAPGTTSELVETDFGFHIISVVDKQAGRDGAARRGDGRRSKQFLREPEPRSSRPRPSSTGLKAKGKIEILI